MKTIICLFVETTDGDWKAALAEVGEGDHFPNAKREDEIEASALRMFERIWAIQTAECTTESSNEEIIGGCRDAARLFFELKGKGQ